MNALRPPIRSTVAAVAAALLLTAAAGCGAPEPEAGPDEAAGPAAAHTDDHAHDPADEAPAAPATQSEYDRVVGSIEARGTAGADAAREAGRATFLIFAASW